MNQRHDVLFLTSPGKIFLTDEFPVNQFQIYSKSTKVLSLINNLFFLHMVDGKKPGIWDFYSTRDGVYSYLEASVMGQAVSPLLLFFMFLFAVVVVVAIFALSGI